MGRSRVAVFIPGASSTNVLQAAAAFGHAEGFKERPSALPNQLMLARGNELVTVRRFFLITSWDIPGGANVTIEVWISSWMGELDVDPRKAFAPLSRRPLWRKVKRLCAAIGAPEAASLFDHSG